MKGMRYGPDQALELGLLHKVVEAEDLDAEAVKYAQGLARQAPLAAQAIKRLVRAAFELPGDQALEREREEFVQVVQSSDAREGIPVLRKPYALDQLAEALHGAVRSAKPAVAPLET